MANYKSNNKPAVRDSFDDDDVSDDVEDEVFIREGRNGSKIDEERGVKRPLMAPRRKSKSAGNPFHPEICKQPQCRPFCVPCCYSIAALVALFGIVSLVVLTINMFQFPLDKIRIWSENIVSTERLILPCIDMRSKKLWVKTFPKLKSEAALKLNDVNQDGIEDIIIGFAAGDEEGSEGERGGVMALHGQTGEPLWQHWTHSSVLYVDCSTDITGDRANDCVASGKGGVLSALNGRDGSIIWELKKPSVEEDVDVYAAQFVNDVDRDSVPDVLTSHSSIKAGEAQGHLVLLSGRTGAVVAQVASPHREAVLSHPQLAVWPDGATRMLFATGSVYSPGGLYTAPLASLLNGNISQSVQLIKGAVNEAPVLVDMNGDGTEDVAAVSADRLFIIDGLTMERMWNASSPPSSVGDSLLLNSPTPVYFNNDEIPDLLFTHAVGTSYPEFYFSQSSVVDGKTGGPLLDQPMVSSGWAGVPGLALSMGGKGNDLVLHWAAVCQGHEQIQQRFSFFNSTPIRQRVRADLCRMRFNSTLELRLYALSQHTAPPGILIYSSEMSWREIHNISTVGGSDSPVVVEGGGAGRPEPAPIVTSFRHKGGPVVQHPHRNYNQNPNHYDNEGLPLSLEDYERVAEDVWRPQEPAFGNQAGRYPNFGMYGIPEPEQEEGNMEGGMDVGGMFPPGRDERAEPRPRRSAANLLPHVGSTGVLAPALTGQGVDLVVTTHWLPGSQPYISLPRDQDCMQQRLASISPDKYTDMEALRTRVLEECVLARGGARPLAEAQPPAQLVVTRLSLQCVCDTAATSEGCSDPLPLRQQSYSARGPNVYFRPRSRGQ